MNLTEVNNYLAKLKLLIAFSLRSRVVGMREYIDDQLHRFLHTSEARFNYFHIDS